MVVKITDEKLDSRDPARPCFSNPSFWYASGNIEPTRFKWSNQLLLLSVSII